MVSWANNRGNHSGYPHLALSGLKEHNYSAANFLAKKQAKYQTCDALWPMLTLHRDFMKLGGKNQCLASLLSHPRS